MGHMATARAAAAASLLSHCNSTGYQQAKCSVASKNLREVKVTKMIGKSSGWTENLLLMIELRKKILTFRDVVDLPPCNGSSPIHELMMGTVKDLHKLYPNVVVCMSLTPEIEEISIHQGLVHLYKALNSIGGLWAKNRRWITNLEDNAEDCLENSTLEQLGERMLAKLKHITDIAKEIFDVMDEDEKNNESRAEGSITGDVLSESYSDHKITCLSPNSPNSIPPEVDFAMKSGEFADMSYSRPHRPHLLPLRLQALGNLQSVGMKSLSKNMPPPHLSSPGSSPWKGISKMDGKQNGENQGVSEDTPITESHNEGPNDSKDMEILPKTPSFDSNVRPEVCTAAPPSPMSSRLETLPLSSPPVNANAATPSPPIPPSKVSVPVPPMPLAKGAAPPPPPPLGVAKALRPKKATTKLKRSSFMGSLYCVLKGKVEGCNGKLSKGRKCQIGGSTGGKQGMAHALAEMAKRSAYFQQIEEDVKKHSKSIMEVKAAINSFQTKDVDELIKFHKYVEQHLEKLTDETQVLARFEGFPTKKLESLRTAAALHLKLEGRLTSLQNWKLEPPLGKLFDKVECYFRKIKEEVDALERSKDEESKRFQSHNIHFDFNILVRIKESMVDVSSGCMELALKERREAKAGSRAESGSKTIQGQAKAHTKMLWRAFQFAFRVYSFAGGQDDRADMLTKELAHEIESNSQHE